MFLLGTVFRLSWDFCGLKEGFCGEVRCGFLGFWFGKDGKKKDDGAL